MENINQSRILGVIGSRTFTDYFYLRKTLLKHQPKSLVSGGAKGADECARRFAEEFGLKISIFYPNWTEFGKMAGFIRNKLIAEACEELVAFVVDNSKGSLDTVETCEKMGKKVYLHEFSSEKEEKTEEMEYFGF